MLEKETSQKSVNIQKKNLFEEYLFEESICKDEHQTNNKILAIQFLSLILV